jgi:hypothetical protein
VEFIVVPVVYLGSVAGIIVIGLVVAECVFVALDNQAQESWE